MEEARCPSRRFRKKHLRCSTSHRDEPSRYCQLLTSNSVDFKAADHSHFSNKCQMKLPRWGSRARSARRGARIACRTAVSFLIYRTHAKEVVVFRHAL